MRRRSWVDDDTPTRARRVCYCISLVRILFAQIAFPPFAFAADRFVGTMPGDYPRLRMRLTPPPTGIG